MKKQIILQRCIACGYSGIVDMNHKLTTYILRNPPDQVSDSNKLDSTSSVSKWSGHPPQVKSVSGHTKYSKKWCILLHGLALSYE